MGYDLLSPTFHMPECNTLQASPPYRRLILWPRGHLKTTILKSIALHILIQPDGANNYFPLGIGALSHSEGTSTRILMASKSAQLAQDTLGEIITVCEGNNLLKAFWPMAFWENPRQQARPWNAEHIVLPRKNHFKEASIETVGVGGQITGYHFNVHIFDDLIDINDANSPTTMQTAIDWWKASRALMDDPDTTLEYTVGTRWAVADLYDYIIKNDPSVEVSIRQVVEDGEPIFPERFTLKTIERLRTEFQERFPLLFMNNAVDPSLTDFDMHQVRKFIITDGQVSFDEDEHDLVATERTKLAAEIVNNRLTRHVDRQPLNAKGWDQLAERQNYIKLRHPRVE